MPALKIKAFQTADDKKYREMLEITSSCNEKYFREIGLEFETFVGIKRGYFPWHACFNRIMYLKEQLDAGFDGWIFYLDADAFIYDHAFNLERLIETSNGDMIFAPGGLTGLMWDVNDGVFLVNLGSVRGRRMVNAWYENFMQTSEDELREASDWQTVPSDQPRLHQVLQDDPDILAGLVHVPRKFFNDENASFVRQVLRANAETFEARVKKIQRAVDEVIVEKSASDLSMTIAGKAVSSIQYGRDYADEFRRVLSTYASCAKTFLEWGAGYTTKITLEHIGNKNCDLFLTIDENAEYLSDIVENHTGVPFLKAKALPTTGFCKDDRDADLNYSTYPLSMRTTFDFIFIDGRRRMECAMMASLLCKPSSIIVLHDYRRARYQPIKALFKIVEDGPQFRVMTPKASLFCHFDEVSPLIRESMLVSDREQF